MVQTNIEDLRPPGCQCDDWRHVHEYDCKVSVRARLWAVQKRVHSDKPITGPNADPFTSKLFQAVVNDELLMAQANLLFNDQPTEAQRNYYNVMLTITGLWSGAGHPAWPLSDAPKLDLRQVVLNGGPPCFALLPGEQLKDGYQVGRARYCGRAKRWPGHAKLIDGTGGAGGSSHEFVSADEALAAAKQATKTSD